MEHEFVALGHAGSDAYAGLESFPNPGVERVEMVSDELTAFCPITHQPDFYTATIAYEPGALCLESKSLKIYLSRFHDQGVFCEALAVQIRDDVAEALELDRGPRARDPPPEGSRRDHDHCFRLGKMGRQAHCPSPRGDR
jgi:7-cyano-7-deazaguanine reductase